MGSKESGQHVVSTKEDNTKQSSKALNDQAKSTTTSYSVIGWWRDFSEKCSSAVAKWIFQHIYLPLVYLSGREFYEKYSSAVGKLLLLLSIAAVSLDPLFFYIPVVKNDRTCLGIDNNLRIIVVVFRTFVDALHTILWWHHGLPSVHGRYRLVAWTVVILAILPLPQVIVFAVSWQLVTVKSLKMTVLIQLVLRLCRIVPAYRDATRSSHMLLIYAWFAAAFNLLMYILASNVLGAFWYLRAVERNMDCWKTACRRTLCANSSLYCDDTSYHKEYLHTHCSIPQANDTKPFEYGIYEEAFQTIIIETDTRFLNKFFQCFWWGLRNLSSFGQNLKAGSHIWENFFGIFITICGLVLFAFLLGNMQTYLQTKTPAKLERMKQREDDLQGWEPFLLLPEKLKREVTWCKEPKWQDTTEVNLESLLKSLPLNLRTKLKPYLCEPMFSNIPELNNLTNELRQELCAHAKPVVFPERSYIFREGGPIHEVVFIVDGNLLCYNEHSKQSWIPAKQLSAGCFFGQELLRQLIQVAQHQQTCSSSSLDLPIASETILAATKVEAFALSIKHLNEAFANCDSRLYKSDVDGWAATTIQDV